uniref:C2 domain-containing protein n=1 Tax=Haemonchus contortus TaxID=6289 RepID=A0A7I5ED90_HAECO
DSSHCDIRSDGLFVEWAARSGRKQLILSEDTSHPLHLKFVCDENQLVKPPGNYNGYLIGFKCPLAKEENARKLSSVLLNISVTMKDVTFDSIGRLAQLVTIWMKDDWSEDFKLLMMAKPNTRMEISGEALGLALLYFRKKCLHAQLSLENMQPEDVYHEALQDEDGIIRVSGIYQAALKWANGQEWKGPIHRKKRQQYLLTPRCLSKIHMLLDDAVTGVTYSMDELPQIELNSDVLLIVGAEDASVDRIVKNLAPWLEGLASRDVQVAIGMAPMEHQTVEQEKKWAKVYSMMKAAADNVGKVANHVRLLDDARAGEWDHPHRSLGTAPYDEHGRIGFYGTKRWYESIRKFWVTEWPPAAEKPKKEVEGLPQKRKHDDEGRAPQPFKRTMSPRWRGPRRGITGRR